MSAYLSALGLNCALGADKATVAQGLWQGAQHGMLPVENWVPEKCLIVGQVLAELPSLEHLPLFNTRNNRLLLQALLQIDSQIQHAISLWGAQRIAVVMGTSTSGIHETGLHIASYQQQGQLPKAYHYHQQMLVDPARFISHHYALHGPSFSVSTACTSGARALISAKSLLAADLCDAVICGGVDSLCRLTLNGFYSLEALSTTGICNPFSANRNGINIGEGAAVFLMTKTPVTESSISLLGAGASSDAYHISAPEPNGKGAALAMQHALQDAQLTAPEISYINLHGTATTHNDAMESRALQQVFAQPVLCSSTKALTGHTLGAAGALEAAFCWLNLAEKYNPSRALPMHKWDGQADSSMPPIALVEQQNSYQLDCLMSNSFAFGGNNTSLILGVRP